ncbi:GNAT family N-acetyltransferase [Shewanella sp. OPT22]|nr:GNAT family N-acetyltransferase [Shewanella sp. OPT22]
MEIAYLADHSQHLDTIAKWYYDEWGNEGQRLSYQDVYEKGKARVTNKGQLPFSFIVKSDNTLMGVAELKYTEHENYPEYVHWLGGVYVCSNHRGKGVARVLVNNAQKHAQALGVKLLYLQCDDHLINFYASLGFKPLHKADYNGDITTIMIWENSHG